MILKFYYDLVNIGIYKASTVPLVDIPVQQILNQFYRIHYIFIIYRVTIKVDGMDILAFMGLPSVKVFFLIKPGKSQILNKQKFYPFPHPNFPNLPKPNNLSCASDIPIHRPDMYRQTDRLYALIGQARQAYCCTGKTCYISTKGFDCRL